MNLLDIDEHVKLCFQFGLQLTINVHENKNKILHVITGTQCGKVLLCSIGN